MFSNGGGPLPRALPLILAYDNVRYRLNVPLLP
jgi:hypothetical protein